MITRKDFVIATVSIIATAAVAALAQSTPKPVTHSCVFGWNSLKPVLTKVGERRQVFDMPTAALDRLECHITTLNPGEAPHAAHRHPEEEVVILKEGTLEVVQNDQTNRVEAGGVIFQAANEMHGFRNVGTNRAVYSVLKCFEPGSAKPKP
jgi:mannose-6-phosphate isomerase-like protein (cupin superfamily)